MKITLIENNQAAKSSIVHDALKSVAEPLGHRVHYYGMHTRSNATRARAITGLGDRIGGGFAAGLLHGLATGAPEQHALDFAMAAAALKHYIPGGFNLSTDDDVDFFLSNSDSEMRR